MSHETSTRYMESLDLRIKPDIVFSENAEKLLFPNSERHREIIQTELSLMLSNYKMTDNIRTNFMGGANRYMLRIFQRLNLENEI